MKIVANSKKCDAFKLIELLVVIAILAAIVHTQPCVRP